MAILWNFLKDAIEGMRVSERSAKSENYCNGEFESYMLTEESLYHAFLSFSSSARSTTLGTKRETSPP